MFMAAKVPSVGAIAVIVAVVVGAPVNDRV